jgi:predicted DNA-binding transcriptional regulator AlpA
VDSKYKYLTLSEVQKLVPFDKKSIRDMAKKGDFPKPVVFGTRKHFWIEKEILDWIEKKVKLRD